MVGISGAEKISVTTLRFFAPLHASHFYEEYPEIARLLGLPPGYRFLFTTDCLDVWFAGEQRTAVSHP